MNVSGTKIKLPDTLETIEEYAFYGNTILNIPKNLKIISRYSFYNCTFQSELILPEGLTTISNHSFDTTQFDKLTIPSTIKSIPDQEFSGSFLKSVIIKSRVAKLDDRMFEICGNLTTAYILNSIKSVNIYLRPFWGCRNLEFVTIESDFNCDWLGLSGSKKYSTETIVSWLEALVDRTS